MVILFLALVYRSPLLVAVPLVTILVSLLVSTGLVALLTQLSVRARFQLVDAQGVLDDEDLHRGDFVRRRNGFLPVPDCPIQGGTARRTRSSAAVRAALTHVGGALTASAFTTILGLGMMFFADFGKFRFSGPVIGLCLAITLLTCVTLTPALMCGLGPYLFWPFGRDVRPGELAAASGCAIRGGRIRPHVRRPSGIPWPASS